MVAIVLLLAAGLIGFGIFVDRRADLREAAIEARYPPKGEIVSVNGRDVHVIVRGTGPDLVLIHGAGGNARDFTYRLSDLLTDRYRVFVVDRPGLGWSEPITPTGAFDTSTDSPRAQARHLSKAVALLGAHDPLVLGHSYGAAVAMGWALDAPTSGVIVLSGATLPWPGPLRLFYRVYGSSLGGAFGAPLVSAFATNRQLTSSLKSVFAPAPVPVDYLTRAGVPLAIRTRHFRTSARQNRALRAKLVAMSPEYPALNLPFEILHGTEDDTVRAEIHAEPLSRMLNNANLTLLDGIGHAPHNVAPEPVIAAIDRLATRAGLR